MSDSTPRIPEGISDEIWLKLGAKVEGKNWVLPERDAQGEVTAWVTRFPDVKKARTGDKRGLTLVWPLDPYAGSTDREPIFVCEGASDTAALLSVGLDAVGRASANSGGAILADLLAHRHVVLVADNDAGGTGMRGAVNVSRHLVSRCLSVRIISPPGDAKDARAAVIAGASSDDFLTLAALTESVTDSDTSAGTSAAVRDTAGKCETLHSDRRLVVRNLSGVEPKAVEWLWPGRIPAGMLTVIAGEPGLGKSTLTADIAAAVTTGRSWIDAPNLGASKPGRVLFLTAEDDVECTLVPRLIGAGANLDLIDTIDGTSSSADGIPDQLDLDRDLDLMASYIEAHPDTRLIVCDPITAYLGTNARDSHNTAVMRGFLARLKALCDRTTCAILAVSHLNKNSQSNSPTGRITGSLALPAAARSVYYVCEDRDDPSRRLLLTAKINIAREPRGLAFRVVEDSDGGPSHLEWETQPVDLTAREYLSAATGANGNRGAADDAARVWLAYRLGTRSVPTKSVYADGKQAGISRRGLERAAVALGVVKEPVAFGGEWIWRMPDSAGVPQSPTASHTRAVPSTECETVSVMDNGHAGRWRKQDADMSRTFW